MSHFSGVIVCKYVGWIGVIGSVITIWNVCICRIAGVLGMLASLTMVEFVELLSMNCTEKDKLCLEKHKPDDKHDLDLEKVLRQQAEEEEHVVEKM